MIGRTNAVSKPGVELSLVVSVTSGAAVTATKGSKTVKGTAAGGSCVLALPEAGTWSVKATLNGQTSDTKSVSVVDSYAVALTFFSATITVNVDSGATVVTITDKPEAPAGKVADYVLCAKSNMVSFVDSLVAPMSVVTTPSRSVRSSPSKMTLSP